MRYACQSCQYCELWNIYTGKCTYEYCPLENPEAENSPPMSDEETPEPPIDKPLIF